MQMNSFIGALLGGAQRCSKRAMKHLQPIIEERQKNLRDLGEDWLEKPVRCSPVEMSRMT